MPRTSGGGVIGVDAMDVVSMGDIKAVDSGEAATTAVDVADAGVEQTAGERIWLIDGKIKRCGVDVAAGCGELFVINV